MRERFLSTSVALAFALVACGGTAPEPETASSSSAEKAEAPATASTEEASSKESAPAKSDSDTTSPPAAAPASPGRSAKDLLLKPGVLYVFSWNASEPHEVAEKHCKQSAKDDPKKMSECMSAASKKVEQDSFAFQQEGEGNYWWLTVKRKGSFLVTLHKIAFDVEKDSADKVTLKPKGPDKGTKPMGGIPHELVVEVEGESSIAIKDPKLGRLVYEAKLGLMGEK